MNKGVETGKRNASLGGLQKYGMLLMGVFLVILAGGRFVTPSAAFLAPIFLLRFTRNTAVKPGVMILYVLLFLSLLVRLHDYFAVARPLSLVLIAGIAVLEILPFLADRTLREYLPTFLRPFVLPCVFVVLGFVVSKLLPFGTMGEKAYTQSGNIELLQLLAVTGTHGITFIMFWFAATMASLWDAGFVWQRSRNQVVPLAVCLMIVFVAGGFRIIFDENESSTVRIAGVIRDQATLQQSLRDNGVENGFEGLSVAGVGTEKILTALSDHRQELLQQSALQAASGARIVVWSEASAVLYKDNEAAFATEAAALAKQHEIYLVASVLVIPEAGIDLATEEQATEAQAAEEQNSDNRLPALENKLIVFGPQGEQLGQYVKSSALWHENTVEGNAKPLLVSTPFGTLAFVIGFDTDFPPLLREASQADIVIAPAADWRTLAPHHSLMATFRGIENGFSVFRPTSKGTSIASDSLGRIIAWTDHFRNNQQSFVADVPTGGTTTFYAKNGDWFAWMNSVILVLLLITAVIVARIRQKQLRQGGGQGIGDPDNARDRSRITAIQWREAEWDNNLHRNNK